ncbi:MAG: hypothetical protein AMJ81_10345 [Phycisphaerae bacterium SM23_33]|nr:MAG: hypothetical protein AMJ81_10345 [Phycisphaerae bacterium SM23_33]
MKGVIRYEADKAWNGYTLFCETFRSPSREGRLNGPIYLIDMGGQPVHQWYAETTVQSYCHLLENGNLLYPTHDRSDVDRGPFGIYELDPDSRVVWSVRCRTDHDFQVMKNGNLMIHTITENFCPRLGPELKRQPYIVEITRQKELVWEWRGEEHLDELEELLSPAGWEHVMDRAHGQFAFDWAHNNTLQIIPPNAAYEKEKAAGSRPRFKPGNIVFSYRSNDVIGVIDRETGRIVWAWGPGVLDGQHKPHLLPNGRILIFDNGTLRGFSRVIEYNPLTDRIEWEYTADPRESFHSRFISGAQRLPNGNTLICEGAKSRLFEVTPDKQIVWEFINPYQAENASHNIYRCTRYSREHVKPLLEQARGKSSV